MECNVMYVCMSVCTYVCMYVCMYMIWYVFIFIYIYIYCWNSTVERSLAVHLLTNTYSLTCEYLVLRLVSLYVTRTSVMQRLVMLLDNMNLCVCLCMAIRKHCFFNGWSLAHGWKTPRKRHTSISGCWIRTDEKTADPWDGSHRMSGTIWGNPS